MPVLGFLFLVFAPFLIGYFVVKIFREKNVDFVITFSTGFLSLFALLFLTTLVSLKFDLSLHNTGILFVAISVIISFLGFVILTGNLVKKRFPVVTFNCHQSVRNIIIVVLGFVLISLISFVYFSPSYINDATLENAYTMLSTDSVYKFSAFTGFEMQAGLPIFNKIYVMPLFYAVLASVFRINIQLMAEYVIPMAVLLLNIILINKIMIKLNANNVISYFCILIAGTYLPSTGTPYTLGYAVLREGYSGYAVCYGILVPLIILFLLTGKRVLPIVVGFTIFGLVRLDRLFYELKALSDTVRSINTAGKLSILFAISILVLIYIKKLETKKILPVFLLPSLLITYAVSVILEELPSNKKVLCMVASVLIIFSTCNFVPYKDADIRSLKATATDEIYDVVSSLNKNDDVVMLSTDSIMTGIRRHSGNIKMLYSVANVNSYMNGWDYEAASPYMYDYYTYANNILVRENHNRLSVTNDEIIDIAKQEGLNVIAMPISYFRISHDEEFKRAGFVIYKRTDSYTIYTLGFDE